MSYPLFSLESFLAFVQTKDPTERYNYFNVNNCACAQYCDFVGATYGPAPTVQNGLERLASDTNAEDGEDDWTFGGLADRIRAEIAVRRAASV